MNTPETTLLVGDCVEVMRGLPGASVDLILTSPPYDKLRRYANGSAFDFEGTAAECKRLLKPGGVLVWVVGDQTIDGSESGTSFRQALHFKAIGLRLRDTMIWRKQNPFSGGDKRSYYRGSFEFMFVMTKGRPSTLSLLREPCKTAGKSVSFARQRGQVVPRRPFVVAPTKIRGNVWDYSISKGGRGHPASFPLQLAVDHVLSWTDPGDTVLDPFSGSGTTLEACVRTGRNGIGIDISPEYVALAGRRLAAARAAG